MAWLTADEYSKLVNITPTAVYKRINTDKLITKKGENGKIMIYLDLNKELKEGLERSHQIIMPKESNEFKTEYSNNDIERIEKFFQSLIESLKASKDNEIKTLKESNEQIIQMKDTAINKQDNEIKLLKDHLQLKDEEITRLRTGEKGFLKKLFG